VMPEPYGPGSPGMPPPGILVTARAATRQESNLWSPITLEHPALPWAEDYTTRCLGTTWGSTERSLVADQENTQNEQREQDPQADKRDVVVPDEPPDGSGQGQPAPTDSETVVERTETETSSESASRSSNQ